MSKPRASGSRRTADKPASHSRRPSSKPVLRSRRARSQPHLGPTGFKNVDLEIGAPTLEALAPIVAALDGTMIQLFHGRLEHLGEFRAHYEILCGREVNDVLSQLAKAIEGFEPAPRAAWDAAATRDFNIGVELERGVKTIEFALDPDVVRRIIDIGGRIAITAYQEVAFPVPIKLDATTIQEALDRGMPRRGRARGRAPSRQR